MRILKVFMALNIMLIFKRFIGESDHMENTALYCLCMCYHACIYPMPLAIFENHYLLLLVVVVGTIASILHMCVVSVFGFVVFAFNGN